MIETNKFITRKRRRMLFIILSALIFIVFIIDLRLRPIIKAVVANKAEIVSTHAINEAVLQELGEFNVKYSDLVTIERNEAGKVLALTTNFKLINQLKAKISIAIQDKLSKFETNRMNMPLGTLLGAEVLSGIGPSIPLRISVSGSVITEFDSKFCEAGINQTKHQIYLNIHTKIGALIPGYPATTNVDTNMTIAETIIVGEVPNVYATGGTRELQTVAQADNIKK